MFLSKIELVGFKSFANKTTFKFNGGITAIVGPNGCGKTNVIDAVRWVLGEQKTSLLRSEVMENVIFNGSTTRKPLGMAEVSITFENNKNILPTHFTQITISRRLFRDGDSHYLLNNTPCRLKDINELLMDTGVGPNSYSIIELKMIETLLNGNIEERRRLLEEAAGVTKFKFRRKETSKNLSNVQTDLIRVYDVVHEIEQQVEMLSRQAAKTRRYNKLHDRLKNLELSLWKIQFQQSALELGKIGSTISDLLGEKVKLLTSLESVQVEIQDLEAKIDALEEQIDEVRENESEFFKKYSDAQNRIALNQSKIGNAQEKQNRLNTEVEEAKKLISKLRTNISKLEAIESEKQVELQNLLNEFEQMQNRYEIDAEAIRNWKEILDSKRAKIIEMENRIKFQNLNLSKAIARSEEIANQKGRVATEIEEFNAKIKGFKRQDKEIQDKIQEEERLLKERNSQLEIFRQQLEELNRKIEQNRSELNEKKIALKEITTTLDFLNSIFEVDESTKFLIRESNWKQARKYYLLGEIISIDENLRIAFDSLLGEFKNIIIVEHWTDVAEAIEILRSKHKGKCYFVVLDEVKEASSIRDLPKDSKIIGFASEIPNVEPKIRTLLRAIVGDYVIVKDFEVATQIAQTGHFPVVVTLQGEIIRNGIVHKRGSILQKEGISIGKLDRIAKLQSKKKALDSEIANFNEDLLSLEKERTDLENSIANLNKEIKISENALRKLNESKQQNELQIQRLQFKVESKMQELAEIDTENHSLNKDSQEIQNELLNLEQSLLELKKEYENEKTDFELSSGKFDKQLDSLRALEKQIAVIQTELSNIKKEIVRLSNTRATQEERLNAFRKEIQSSSAEVVSLSKLNIELQKEVELLSNELADIKAKKEYLIGERRRLDDLLSQQNAFKESIHSRIERFTNQIHQLEIEKAKLSETSHSVFQKAIESYGVNLNDMDLEQPEEFNPAEAEAEIQKLRNSLSSMGNINFLALQEYEEQNQRLQFYRTQIEDLTKSEKSLREALQEINSTAEERFSQTFSLVNQNFNKVFTELFGGDSFAELVIDRENLLESDIEIRAKPPGKRLHSIETLSQGEKTLTALSFLFAIYLVKPSPFCILDEVDAPLDDANVERFLNLLSTFSKNIQFILITHNRRTMEFADVLYGITMADDGISKVLSVKLIE